MDEEKSKIFRKEALKKLYSQEELNQLFSLVKPKGWIALITSLVVVFLALLWAFLGRIDTIVSGEGIYIDFTQVRPITIPVKGRVMNVLITIGEPVKKDQIIAILWNEEEGKKIEVRSPENGIVVDIHIESGGIVLIDELIADVQKYEKTHKREDLFYCFIDARQGDKVRKGMSAHVFPWSISKNLYGGIVSNVEKISFFPATEEYFNNLRINEVFASNLSANYSLIPLIIKPVQNLKDPLGYVWTSKSGPEEANVPLGSFVTFQVIIESRPPISYLFPFWYLKKLEKETLYQDE